MNRRQLIAGGAAVTVVAAGSAATVWHMGSSQDYDGAVTAMRSGLAADPATIELIRYATLAASGHNTQPWRFRVAGDRIDILPDTTRRTPVVDPDDHHLFVSLGCATENLMLAAAARGRPGRAEFVPADGGAVAFISAAGAPVASELFDAIPRRQSTRANYDGRPVPTETLRALIAAAATPGVDMVLLTDRPRIERIADLVARGNSAQRADPAFVRELKHWLRFNPRAALESGDGLFSMASGSPALPSLIGPIFFDLFAGVDAENDKYRSQLRSSAGVAVFIGARADPAHWVQVGRACQRFALQATALGLKHAHINQPVEVPSLRSEIAGLVGAPGRRPDIVMRFGYGPTLPYSARRPVQSVLA